MSVDAQERVDPVRQQRTDDAMHIAEPVHNPRVGPRVIPVVVTIVIGIVLVALLYLAPWG
jgi:hypothetical protein